MKEKIARVIIAGGRDFNDYDLLVEKVDYFLSTAISQGYKIIIVSGTAKGADKLGEQYAKERGYEVAYFPADWASHGKRAGYLRNQEMAKYAKEQGHGALIAFWDEKSKGTKHMIDIAKKDNLHIRVVNY